MARVLSGEAETAKPNTVSPEGFEAGQLVRYTARHRRYGGYDCIEVGRILSVNCDYILVQWHEGDKPRREAAANLELT
jgi:hypothetical protein